MHSLPTADGSGIVEVVFCAHSCISACNSVGGIRDRTTTAFLLTYPHTPTQATHIATISIHPQSIFSTSCNILFYPYHMRHVFLILAESTADDVEPSLREGEGGGGENHTEREGGYIWSVSMLLLLVPLFFFTCLICLYK
jgi:hypothetical protein